MVEERKVNAANSPEPGSHDAKMRLLGNLEAIQADMRYISVDSLKDDAQKLLQDTEILQSTLLNQAAQVAAIVEEMQLTIAENLNTPANLEGCLLGEVEDFLDSFDTQKKKLEDALAKSHTHWENKLSSDMEAVSGKIAEFSTLIEQS